MDNKFTSTELDFFRELKVPENINKKIIGHQPELDDDDLLCLHDLVTEALQVRGFDKDYSLTAIGKQAEALIDKLHDMLENKPKK